MFNFRSLVATALLVLAAGLTASAWAADADPTVAQVYSAANAGHLAEAQQMMSQVLRDHPRSAVAHYVAAELDARGGNYSAARQELANAETLDPSDQFAKPAAIAALRNELSRSQVRYVPGTVARPSFPWVPVLLIGGGLAIAWAYLRRRAQLAALQSPYPYPGATGYPGGYPGGIPPGGAPMGGPLGYPGAMGGGSGIMGGLASGLAVGAGVVAGEELARHVLGGDRAMGAVVPPQGEIVEPNADPNADMGGNDFGVNDPNSWDDGGGSSWGDDGGGSGGGDWT